MLGNRGDIYGVTIAGLTARSNERVASGMQLHVEHSGIVFHFAHHWRAAVHTQRNFRHVGINLYRNTDCRGIGHQYPLRIIAGGDIYIFYIVSPGCFEIVIHVFWRAIGV